MKFCKCGDGFCEEDYAMCDECSKKAKLCKRCGKGKFYQGTSMCKKCLIELGGACEECGDPCFYPGCGRCDRHHDKSV